MTYDPNEPGAGEPGADDTHPEKPNATQTEGAVASDETLRRSVRWIPSHRRDELRQLALRSRQVVLLAALTGIVTGLVVAGFDRLVVDGMFAHVLELPLWAIAVLPGVGLVVSAVARRYIGPHASPATSDEYLHAFHDPEYRLGWRTFAARMVAAMATLGSGAPMGLEGSSMYAGATIGSHLQRRFPNTFKNTDRRTLLVAGAAAGVSAIFKAPATGVVFALEVPFQGDLARRMLLPSLVSSATSYLVFAAINGTNPLFPGLGSPGFGYRDLIGAVIVGLLAGVGARGFAWMLRKAKSISATAHAVPAIAGAGIALAVTFILGRLLTGESLLVGAGYQVLTWASDPARSAWVVLAILVLRCVATSASIAGGGVGGLFIPLVVAGALSGAVVGHVVNRVDLSFFIVIGVAAFLGAGYRVPLAAIMFVAETTGRPSFVVPALVAAVAAELAMGESSVTRYQKNTPHLAPLEFQERLRSAIREDEA